MKVWSNGREEGKKGMYLCVHLYMKVWLIGGEEGKKEKKKKGKCKENKKNTFPELNVDLLLTAAQEGMHGAKVEQAGSC
jgi:hypothetical protein